MLFSKLNYQVGRYNLKLFNFHYSFTAFILAACGSATPGKKSFEPTIGFSSSYEPPEENYIPPLSTDPNFKIFEPKYNDPYWINALVMDDGDKLIRDLLNLNENQFFSIFQLKNLIMFPSLYWDGSSK